MSSTQTIDKDSNATRKDFFGNFRNEISKQLNLDPEYVLQIEEQSRKKKLTDKIALEIEAGKISRREKIVNQTNENIQEKQKYLTKMETKLDEFIKKGLNSESQLQNQLKIQTETWESSIKSTTEKAKNNILQFQRIANQKRQELDNQISHERKIIEKLNDQAQQQVQKKKLAAITALQLKKTRLKQDMQKQDKYYMAIINRLKDQVEEAKKEVEPQVIDRKLKEEEDKQIKEKLKKIEETQSKGSSRTKPDVLLTQKAKLFQSDQQRRSRDALKIVNDMQNLTKQRSSNRKQ